MTLKLKVIGLACLWLLFALLLLYLAGLVADRVNEAGRAAGEQNIRVRILTHGEVER